MATAPPADPLTFHPPASQAPPKPNPETVPVGGLYPFNPPTALYPGERIGMQITGQSDKPFALKG